MIELTEDQLLALSAAEDGPPRVVNPHTQETFVLLRADVYDRLTADPYDDSPWTRKELESLAWQTGNQAGWDEMGEYDAIPDKS